MPYSKNIEIINVGDQLLLGINSDNLLPYIAKFFASIGTGIRRSSVIKHNKEDIESDFEQAWSRSDILVINESGNVRRNVCECIANVLGVEVERSDELKEFFIANSVVMDDVSMSYCYKPAGFEFLYNENNLFPGLFYKKDDKFLIILPGFINGVEKILEGEVLPRFQKSGMFSEGQVWTQMRVFGLPREALHDILGPIRTKHKGLSISYKSHYQLVDLFLSRVNASITGDQLQDITEECRKLVGDNFVCYGQKSQAQILVEQLRDRGETISVAESCTGGLLSNEFTNIPGASKVFMGSVICYVDESKIDMLGVSESIITQHGAVSEEAAVALATGAADRFGTNYALSTTGFAGPTGGNEKNPLGTVYIGFHSPKGAWACKIRFRGQRRDINNSAVGAALDYMRRKLHSEHIIELLSGVD